MMDGRVWWTLDSHLFMTDHHHLTKTDSLIRSFYNFGQILSPRSVEEKKHFYSGGSSSGDDRLQHKKWLAYPLLPIRPDLNPRVLKSNIMIPPFFSLDDTVIIKAMRYHTPVITKCQKLQCAPNVPSTSRKNIHQMSPCSLTRMNWIQ